MKLNPLKRFWNLLKIYSIDVRQIYIYALFVGFINLTLPLGIQAIINFLQTGNFTSTWLLLVGFVLFGIVVSGILQILQIRVVETIQQDLFARSAFEFAYRIPKITYLQLDKVHAPELVNRFFDTLTIQKGIPKILIDFSLAIFQIFFGLVLLAVYSPYFILLGIVLAAILWIIFRITGPPGLATSIKESKYKYQLAHWLEEIGRVNRSFKIFAKSKLHLSKTDSIVGNYIMSRESHFQVLLKQFKLFVGLKVIVAASLLLLGGSLVFNDRMNIGQFVAAEIIILLILNSIEKLIATMNIIFDVLTALDKIGYVTDISLDNDIGSAVLYAEKGLAISARNISFNFPSESKKVLDELSFDIHPNEKVILEGRSGSGKSILLQIIARIYKLESGELYINEIPISHYHRDDYYESLSMSFSVNQIFEGTIRDNILMGRNIDDKVLTDMIKLLNLTDFLGKNTEGINTYVDSGGRLLPRSVIQKILIARAIIGEPKLLLMEDPLHFIKDEEKKKIIDHIMSKDRNWTVLVISDYYYWAEKCDRTINISE